MASDAVFVPISGDGSGYYGAPRPSCTARWATRRVLFTVVGTAVVIGGIAGIIAAVVNEKRKAGPVTPAYALNETALPNSFTFVSMGDWGRDGAWGQTDVAATMANVGSLVKANIVVSLGDDFYPNGVNSKTDSQFTTSWLNIYTQPFYKGRQWVLALGNKEYQGSYLPVNWPGDSRWYEPDRYFAVKWNLPTSGGSSLAACVLAIFLDTTALIDDYRTNPENANMALNLLSANATAQLQWLEAQLDANSGSGGCRSTVVVAHQPIFSSGNNGDEPDLINRVLPLLRKYSVDAYMSGHAHNMQHLTQPVAPMDFIVSGAGSQTSDGRTTSTATPEFFSSDNGFVVTSMNETHIRHSWVDAAGYVAHGVTRQMSRTM